MPVESLRDVRGPDLADPALGRTGRSPGCTPTRTAAPTPTCSAPDAGRLGRGPLPQGRVDAPDRQPQAPAGPLAVPLRALQRRHRPGHHGGRGLQRLDRDQRGVLRPPARAAVRRRDAALDQPGEGRADRVRRRPLPLRRARRARSTTRPAGWPTRLGGHYLDQFTYAERATDWRGNNNIAESIFDQLAAEPHPVPAWIVVGAGTGGTCATIGRYLRYRGYATRLAVVDPEGSAFLPAYDAGEATSTGARLPHRGHRPAARRAVVRARVVDRMIAVPDAASIAAMRFLPTGHRPPVGGSTGTNLWGSLRLAARDARRTASRQHRHAAVRPVRPVRHDLLPTSGGCVSSALTPPRTGRCWTRRGPA